MESEWGLFIYLFLKGPTHSRKGFGWGPLFLMSAFSSSYFVPLIILEEILTSLNYSSFLKLCNIGSKSSVIVNIKECPLHQPVHL